MLVNEVKMAVIPKFPRRMACHGKAPTMQFSCRIEEQPWQQVKIIYLKYRTKDNGNTKIPQIKILPTIRD